MGRAAPAVQLVRIKVQNTMENIEKIIQAIDIQLIQKNKPYMLLAEANRLLTSTRLIADNKALKKE